MGSTGILELVHCKRFEWAIAALPSWGFLAFLISYLGLGTIILDFLLLLLILFFYFLIFLFPNMLIEDKFLSKFIHDGFLSSFLLLLKVMPFDSYIYPLWMWNVGSSFTEWVLLFSPGTWEYRHCGFRIKVYVDVVHLAVVYGCRKGQVCQWVHVDGKSNFFCWGK